MKDAIKSGVRLGKYPGMKSSAKLPLLSLLTLLVLASACKESEESSISPLDQDQLIGIWNLDQVMVKASDGQNLRTVYQQYYESLGVPPGAGLEASLDSIEATFKQPITDIFGEDVRFIFEAEDDSFFYYERRQGSMQGRWQLTDDRKLTITENSRTSRFTITTAGNPRLVLVQSSEEFNDFTSFGNLRLTIPPGIVVQYTLTK
ncbi:MAG: hypothetical protein RIG62_18040 [Cyclobacteriaceae bacterium]